MVATDTEVMGWVEKQLQDNPEVTVDELFEGAKILQPDVAELNKRQFHARYPLQVKRRAKRAAAAAAAAEAASEAAAEAAAAPAEAPAPAPAPTPAPAKGKTTTDAEVMSWVEGQLKDNPDVSVDELLAGAVKLNAGIAELTKRQFHARYPLQVKRAAKPGGGCRGGHQAPSPPPQACGPRARARAGCCSTRSCSRARACSPARAGPRARSGTRPRGGRRGHRPRSCS